MILKGDPLSLHMDEIVLIKGFGGGLHGHPNPALHLPRTVSQFQFQVGISSFGDARRFLFNQKEGIHILILFDFVDIDLHGVALPI
jgi:hypothetical protein